MKNIIFGVLLITSAGFGINCSLKNREAKCVYIVSHNPMGGPWVLEKWWTEEELWVPIQAYHNKISAFDVRERLEKGEIRPVELLR